MRVLHYIPSIDRASGGVGSYLQLLAQGLGQLCELHVVTHTSDNELHIPNATIHYIPKQIKSVLKIRRQFISLCQSIQPDIFHSNCCWLPLSALTTFWAKSQGLPIVYSPHGMLEPWILSRNYYTRKLPALLLYQRRAITISNQLHATADSEALNLKKLGYNKKIFVVPNCIDVEAIQIKESWHRRKKILFLSRVHPKKGINFLIDAVAALRDQMNDYEVIIAGEGTTEYINELKSQATTSGVDNIFKFVGGIYGPDKWRLYQAADLFVLPTHSENFGIVVAESLASGTPVVTTTGTPWQELTTYNCGWYTPVGTAPLIEAIKQFFALSPDELKQMGINGRRLVSQKYSVKQVAEEMYSAYKNILK